MNSNTQQTQLATDATAKSGKNEAKRSRGTFPRISLKKALELPEIIYKIGQGEPVRRLNVFNEMGKSAESGTSRMLITTSNSYGLTTGGYQAERLTLTDIGTTIITTTSKKLKYEKIYDVLFKN